MTCGRRIFPTLPPLPEQLAASDEQLPLLGDDVADEVREAAVGERDMGATVEDDDLR
jgi:hypothetical protein